MNLYLQNNEAHTSDNWLNIRGTKDYNFYEIVNKDTFLNLFDENKREIMNIYIRADSNYKIFDRV
jgi:hypothetical protein